MSYDFFLFRAPIDEGHTIAPVKEDPEQESPGTIAPGGFIGLSKDEVKQRLADLLLSKHPAFQESEKDYQQIAQSKSITEAEARQRYRHIELTDNDGLQVTLFGDTAGVTMPFLPNPENRLRTAWECLKILESQGRFSTYDQQIGRNLDLESDFEVVKASYLGANRIVDRTMRKK